MAVSDIFILMSGMRLITGVYMHNVARQFLLNPKSMRVPFLDELDDESCGKGQVLGMDEDFIVRCRDTRILHMCFASKKDIVV